MSYFVVIALPQNETPVIFMFVILIYLSREWFGQHLLFSGIWKFCWYFIHKLCPCLFLLLFYLTDSLLFTEGGKEVDRREALFVY